MFLWTFPPCHGMTWLANFYLCVGLAGPIICSKKNPNRWLIGWEIEFFQNRGILNEDGASISIWKFHGSGKIKKKWNFQGQCVVIKKFSKGLWHLDLVFDLTVYLRDWNSETAAGFPVEKHFCSANLKKKIQRKFYQKICP